jgi:hypothetical protein
MRLGETEFGVEDVLAQGNLFAQECKDAEMRDLLRTDILTYCLAVSYAANGEQLAKAIGAELKQRYNVDADALCVFDLLAAFIARHDKGYVESLYSLMLEVTAEMELAHRKTLVRGKNKTAEIN